MRFKDSEDPLPEIAEALSVDAIVEGTVLRVGDKVRISAKLISATDENLWGSTYDRELEDVLVLISEVAGTVAEEIEIAVTPEQRVRLASARAVTPAAHEMYLRARFFTNQGTPANIRRGVGLYEQAIDLDPAFARAHAGLAAAEFLSLTLGGAATGATASRAEESALRALELDDALSEAHSALGLIRLYHDWDWEAARGHLEQAISLNPGDTLARHGLADYLLTTNQVDESVRQLQLARESDPLSPLTMVPLLAHLTLARRYEDAVNEGRSLLELFPEFPMHGLLASALWHRGRYEESLDAYREALGAESPLFAAMETAYAKLGAQAAMHAAGVVLADAPRVSPLYVASRFAAAGDVDLALEWLERAFQRRNPQLPHIRVDPDFDPIRDDPRFQDILGRMNFPE